MFKIYDWAGNELDYFGTFKSFDDAEYCLSKFISDSKILSDSYDINRGEYFIKEIKLC